MAPVGTNVPKLHVPGLTLGTHVGVGSQTPVNEQYPAIACCVGSHVTSQEVPADVWEPQVPCAVAPEGNVGRAQKTGFLVQEGDVDH